MKQPSRLATLATLATLAALPALTGCATALKPISKDKFGYSRSEDPAGVSVGYRHAVLFETGNTRYGEKARIQGVDVVAVELRNNTDRAVDVAGEVEFLSGSEPVRPANPHMALANVRQRTGMYAWWLLLTPFNITKTEVECSSFSGCEEDVTFIPFGLVLGPGIAIGNMAVASSANTALMKEIAGNDLSTATLQPGQSAKGYLVFRDIGGAPISARLRNARPAPVPAPASFSPPTVSADTAKAP